MLLKLWELVDSKRINQSPTMHGHPRPTSFWRQKKHPIVSSAPAMDSRTIRLRVGPTVIVLRKRFDVTPRRIDQGLNLRNHQSGDVPGNTGGYDLTTNAWEFGFAVFVTRAGDFSLAQPCRE